MELSSRPAQALLAYLAINPQVNHRREKLAGRLWPDSTESNARSNLRQALWRLRKAVGEQVIEAGKSTLRLSKDHPTTIDVVDLERGAERASSSEDWVQWAALYKGELLPGWYDDWVVLERERLEALFTRNMPSALQTMVDERRWDDVLKWAEHWISLGHVPEPAFRALMTAHAALGDAAALASTYERCAQALETDLGVELSPETRSHYESLRSGDHPAVTRRPSAQGPERPGHNLPAQTTAFIGREREIEAIVQRFEGPDDRLVTVTGPGGTGKTRLAFEVVSRLAPQFEHGAWFVALAPLADPDFIPPAIAGVLGVKERGQQAVLGGVKDFLVDRELLLLLDNFEHLIEGAPVVGELLASAPGLRCLVTSRERLRVYGEHELPLVPLSLPDPAAGTAKELLEASDAARLFFERARAAEPDFELTETNSGHIAHICRRLDGLPLAIELAAARMRLFSPEALAERLEDRLGTLTGGPRDAPARQRTLRDTLEWSHSLLSTFEQDLFARFGVFAGGCNLTALQAVCDDIQEYDLVDGLDSLIAKSLVYREGGPAAEPRLRMLETLQEFARERLEAQGDRTQAEQRHARHFAELAQNAAAELEDSDTVEWLERLEADHSNLRAALAWALDHGDVETGLQIVGGMARFWVLRGYLSEGYAAARSALELAGPEVDLEIKTRAVIGAARLAYRQNNIDAASAHYAEGLELSRRLEEAAWIANCLIGVGMVETERGIYESVEEKFEEALALYSDVDDLGGMANAILNLAWAAIRTGDYTTAETHLHESLRLCREANDRSGIGFCLSGLGEVYLRVDELDKATEYLDESLTIRESLGDKWGMGATLGSIGWVALRQQNWPRAERRLSESLSLRRELGDKGGMAWCLEKLAEASLATGREARAGRLYGAARAIRDSIGSSIDPADQGPYEARLERIHQALGDAEFERAWRQGADQPALVLDDLLMDSTRDP